VGGDIIVHLVTSLYSRILETFFLIEEQNLLYLVYLCHIIFMKVKLIYFIIKNFIVTIKL